MGRERSLAAVKSEDCEALASGYYRVLGAGFREELLKSAAHFLQPITSACVSGGSCRRLRVRARERVRAHKVCACGCAASGLARLESGGWAAGR